jgi:hypothetical protein
MQCNCKCNSLVISFPSHQVPISTHTLFIHFSAFSLHNPPLSVTSNQHARHHEYYEVAGQCGDSSHYCTRICTHSRENSSKRWERWNVVGPYISYGLFQTTGKTCAEFWVPIGAEMWICIRYKLTCIHTYIQTFIFIYKIYLLITCWKILSEFRNIYCKSLPLMANKKMYYV